MFKNFVPGLFIYSSHTTTSSFFFVKTRFFKLVQIFFKYSFLYQNSIFLDLFALDKPNKLFRFSVQTVFRNNSNKTFFFNVNMKNTWPVLESLSGLYNGVAWAEREAFDFYGIYFTQNLDLRRILTDYGFEGFPIRKDFPLSGYTQIRYDDSTRRIVVEPIELLQEYRTFDFKSPWVR